MGGESKKRVREEAERISSRKSKEATEIVNLLVNEINDTIIRPGPKPEERQCTEVAQELLDLKPHLINLILERV